MMFISLGIGAVVAIALIVVVSILTGGGPKSAARTANNALVGTTVGDFKLSSLAGGTLRAPYASGHPTVIFFFASWCGPCHAELPRVAKYLASHNEGPVSILGIDEVDAPQSGLAFARGAHVRFPLASDPSGSVESGIFKFAYLPYTVFVDAKGKVEGVDYGDISLKRLAGGLAVLKSA